MNILNIHEFNEWLAAAKHQAALQDIAEGHDPADVQADCRGSALFSGVVREFRADHPDQDWDSVWSAWYQNCENLRLDRQPCWQWVEGLA
mgnify:CR=1 FL=1